MASATAHDDRLVRARDAAVAVAVGVAVAALVTVAACALLAAFVADEPVVAGVVVAVAWPDSASVAFVATSLPATASEFCAVPAK
jgi:hypothetical protein